MPSGKQEQGKRIALVALAVICALLVYRNLVVPARDSVSASVSREQPAGSQSAASRQQEDALRASAPQAPRPEAGPGRRDRPKGQQELAALDPTLRLDLLQKAQEVKYEGSFRNIFQFYTPPPPKPVADPLRPPATPPQPTQPPPPPPANIPLKFYGVASRPGLSEKKAFLVDGDEIYIGQEGDTIDKNYKITRIGVNSIILEDIRTKQQQQLPLIEE